MGRSFFWRFEKLSDKIEKCDEPWIYSEEPHTSRRQEILTKYPEIKKLMGYDPMIAVIVGAEVFIQCLLAWYMRDASWGTIICAGYIFSATINHSLGSAIHEIGHNLAFGHKYPLRNRALGVICNLPMVVPISVTYKKYHADHHRYLGHDTMDVDVPTVIENYLFRHPLTKMFWLFIHPLIHGVRPFFKSPKPLTLLEVINFICQATFDVIILQTLGYRSLAYLALGTFFGLGFHPLAGHFISEHYMFTKGQATHSYYGPLNFLVFNVGYHVEHHDFPYVPFSRLPQVRAIAGEYYNNLPYHTSWLKVLYDFIFDKDMGPHAHGVGYLQNEHDEVQNGDVKNGKVPNGEVLNGKVPNGKVTNGEVPNGKMPNGTSDKKHA